MPDNVTIRDYRPPDLSRVLDIAVAAWAPIYASYRAILGESLFIQLHTNWQEGKRRQVADGCAGVGGAAVLVAELKGDVVGFVTFRGDRAAGIGEIGNNAVDPAHQGRGIAPAMYAEVFERLRQQGLRFVKVSTGGDPSHAPARRAYQKAGFETALPHVDYFREL